MVLNVDLNLPAVQENEEVNYSISIGLPALRRSRDEYEDDVTVISPRTYAAETNQRSSRRQRTSLPEIIYDTSPPLPQYFNPDLTLSLALPSFNDWGLSLSLAPPVSNNLGKEIATEETPETQHPQLTCPICITKFTEETATKCGHIFCKECIYAAIRVQKKCPTCRMKLRLKDTLRVYLSN